ncbi:AEC family transporter [Curtobacterium aurantiacum]|uniref:AEC family transporter n=1 Tax=Curtobacterium aurantiacum TaxID=3236919 RepID=UPI0027DFEB09|nr:AEC family transporter [Curtobacterium flaccumfaciens]
MGGVLTGFAIIGAIIAGGYVVGRIGLLGPHAQFVMSRLAFFVLMPCLLFHTIATADIASLLSSMLWVSLLSAAVVALGAAAVFRLVLRRPVTTTTVGALASSYVNANNIGLPVAVYVLGQATAVVPVILLQLVVMAPIALTILDAATAGGGGWGRRIAGPFRNPIIIASLVGLVCSATGITLPDPVLEPFSLVGAAAVPVVLLSFGMSLHGATPLRDPAIRTDVIVASSIKHRGDAGRGVRLRSVRVRARRPGGLRAHHPRRPAGGAERLQLRAAVRGSGAGGPRRRAHLDARLGARARRDRRPAAPVARAGRAVVLSRRLDVAETPPDSAASRARAGVVRTRRRLPRRARAAGRTGGPWRGRTGPPVRLWWRPPRMVSSRGRVAVADSTIPASRSADGARVPWRARGADRLVTDDHDEETSDGHDGDDAEHVEDGHAHGDGHGHDAGHDDGDERRVDGRDDVLGCRHADGRRDGHLRRDVLEHRDARRHRHADDDAPDGDGHARDAGDAHGRRRDGHRVR